MKLFILMLLELLFIINTLELPFDRNNLNYNNFINNNNNNDYNFQQSQNRRYNEMQSSTQRNHRQFNSADGSSHFGKINSNNFHGAESQRNQSSQPPVPNTLEFPTPQQLPNEHITKNSITIPRNSDRIIFPDDKILSSNNNLKFSKEENVCFTQFKVYYNESCEELLNELPCDEGEWLVVDLKGVHQTPQKIKPKCDKKMCIKGEVFWFQNNRCYKDEPENHQLFCPTGNKFGHDFFGHGMCVCKDLHALHTNGTCYPLYTPGPCLKGYLFVENNGKTECILNPCQNSSLVQYAENGFCYELGTQGPCENNYTFQVSKDRKKPTCTDNVAILSAVSPPPFSTTKSTGNGSRDTVNSSIDQQILEAARSKAKGGR